MNNMKRFLAILLAAALMAAVLCGCGDNGNTDPTDSTPSNSEPSNPTEPSDESSAPSTEEQKDGKVTYTVTVLDQNNNPVAGVSIQFCDDVNCKMPVNTDANGVVTQRLAASNYHIKLVGLPSGYTCEESEIYFGEETSLTVVVKAE